jgi:hypothetical protein
MIKIQTTPITQVKKENTEKENAEKEKVAQLEKELSESKKAVPTITPEELIKQGLNEEGRIHKNVLEYILKEEIGIEVTVGNLTLRRVYLGGGVYEVQI